MPNPAPAPTVRARTLRTLACALACQLAVGCGADADGAPDRPPGSTGTGPGDAAQAFVSTADAAPSGLREPDAGAPAREPSRDPSTPDDPVPGADDAGRALGALQRLGAHALVALAVKLETGAPMSDVERACLGAHDPALGQPLTGLECVDPLSVAGTAVAVTELRALADDACLAVLGDASRSDTDVVAGCDWAAAAVRLDTEWVPPPQQLDGDHQGRPRPLPGAMFDYRAEAPDTLVVSHLESRLTGRFTCAADVVTGRVEGDAGCAVGVADFAARLEAFARRLDAPAPN